MGIRQGETLYTLLQYKRLRSGAPPHPPPVTFEAVDQNKRILMIRAPWMSGSSENQKSFNWTTAPKVIERGGGRPTPQSLICKSVYFISYRLFR